MQEFESLSREELERLAKQDLDNLTSVQERCTELLEENRSLKEFGFAARPAHLWGPVDGSTRCRLCGIAKDKTHIGGLVPPSPADICPELVNKTNIAKHSWQPIGRSDVPLKCIVCGATSLTISPDPFVCHGTPP